MDIEARLEAEHSKSLTTAIVAYVGEDKERFAVLMQVFLKGESRVSQRAAWPLSFIAEQHPQLMRPYLDELLKKLEKRNQHPAIARNILRSFQQMDIPEKHHAVLVDLCFTFIKDQTCPAAIRAFAITVATNICRLYPELKNELYLILNELNQFPQLPAVKSRTKLSLKSLGYLNSKI